METKQLQKSIPNGWKVTSFGDVATLRKGLTYKSSDYSDKENGLVFLTLKAILRGGGFNTDGVKYYLGKYDSTSVVKEGDLIIANTDITRDAEVVGAPVFVPFLSNKPVVMSMDLSAIDVDNKKIDKLFFYYLLREKKARDFMRAQASGSTVLHLKTGNVPKFGFLLPSLFEQKRIAEILSSVDEEIQKNYEIISQTEKLKNGLIQDIFTKNHIIKKLKIKDISEVTSSKRVMVSDYVDGGIPFYRSTEIIKKSKNIPLTNLLYISAEKFNFFKDRFGAPEKGDILITAVGTIGDVYMVQNEVFYFKDGNTIWVRKIKDLILPEYLRMILGSNFYREKLNNIAGGSSQKALTIQKLENVEVPVPSISEQKRLIEIISSVENETRVCIQIKNNLNHLKKGLTQDLLSGKVRTI